MGDLVVVYLEAEDLAAFGGVGTSTDPFDVWFGEHNMDVHAIDLAAGFPQRPAVGDPCVITGMRYRFPCKARAERHPARLGEQRSGVSPGDSFPHRLPLLDQPAGDCGG